MTVKNTNCDLNLELNIFIKMYQYNNRPRSTLNGGILKYCASKIDFTL